ncbi:tRNA (adenosine(37)-N6)-threonylcarbamoyltransferase complex dimerization subunit type 1 TsaB [Aquabacterium sp. A7-Y]|uniref:tRNA (adenosine(37)-N6)-threonylcarbamoyltransferase complex dimerization subunit type 1 TsaB n=1 Tax=Aquabacterium sp. A7-Y TaxID=1349605 RepID=UPI00223CD6C1|nr:tRNA (adenosine(37)-N6)-threonylcarbamoyltransferase complex dimerization subunit type 1 TsaB [Aquabacterium sp. A7-Y]MCW7539093.1 tRNA (adenosine(37)-N6)-threonylcarbamoyltransferase complex dimerization subunit type 1 TsaB [Aquabacterium sp. A7-Y]
MPTPSPVLLALETATETLRLGALTAGRVHTREGAGGAQASVQLLPAVLALLEETGLRLQDLDAIAFGRGPGAFTGLRTACSVAQGLAFGAGKPVLPVDTLLIVAEAARRDGGAADVWVAQDARMNEIYAARYRHDGGRWHTLREPALYSAAALAERIAAEGGECLAGNALALHAEPWQALALQRLPDAVPDAAALLQLAAAGWSRGEAVDAALALPLYIRDKVAQTTAEREAAARAAAQDAGARP